ncbi:hypothetical protein ITJ43_11430 [Microbacterium sp. VKM Ac-2870]|uniref:hypothetical protein n=1 Tax=Microbacterium sp. VKM Ac-2870 TaxID=2783825 RepID=UPI001889DD11|nr:hypothetical protein [Microbacterium sp. VKM Ac-2870]MBF4562751.1 hypothetical protein [Microbacterium sp. VKM Ac-2870]
MTDIHDTVPPVEDAAGDVDGADITVEFAGEYVTVASGTRFTIGREGDLAIDDNRFLHRHFLSIEQSGGLWWLVNIGSRLSATVTDTEGRVQAQLAPGARLPIVFGVTTVVFSAGPTTYELSVHTAQPAFRETTPETSGDGESTIGAVPLTPSQKLLILALAEPVLRREGTGMSELPSSASAAQRLGWSITRFNRKLDNVCDKLDRQGVPGLRGGVTTSATNRRVRLVEHAIASRLVVRDDLAMLDDPAAHDREAGDDSPRRKEDA